MWRSSATTALIAEALLVLNDMVGVLSDLDRGAAKPAVGTYYKRVASWRTMAASLRSEIVIFPSRFFDETKYSMISSGQG